MRILVMTAAFGTGHNQVASAVAEAAIALGHQAEVVDGLSASAPMINTVMTHGFIRLLKTAPGLYRIAYNRSELPGGFGELKQGFHQLLTRLMGARLLAMLANKQPDYIICTHPFILGVLANLRLRGRIQAPVAGVLTDFAPHAFWVHAGVDRYFVATPAMRQTMTRQGVPAERIHVTGIPVRAAFGSAFDRQVVARSLGLDPACPTLLLMGGGLGMGPIRELVADLSAVPFPLQVLVVTGQNRRLYEELLPFVNEGPDAKVAVHVYGFVTNIHELMAASDLLVGKAGAVTAAEALAMGLPAFFVQPIPGHEERNQAVLVATGAARTLATPERIREGVAQLFTLPEELAGMRAAARRTGRPHAAEAVIAGVMQTASPAVAGDAVYYS